MDRIFRSLLTLLLVSRCIGTLSLLFFLIFSHNLIFSQRVGIGTESPTETLDVAGNIRVDSAKLNAMLLPLNAGSGKVLTSDASGNASWQMMITPPANPVDNVGYGLWGDCATSEIISNYNPASEPAGKEGDLLGFNVSISGNFAVAGAPDDDEPNNAQGSASFFQFNGTTWEFIQKVSDPSGNAIQTFGNAVAMDGYTAFIGASRDDPFLLDQGSVSVYIFDGASWQFMTKLTDPFAGANDNFGSSVSVSGNFAIIGSPGDFGQTFNEGSACFFQFDGTNWNFMQKVFDAQPANTDEFGCAVHIKGNRAIIGAWQGGPTSSSNMGSANIYEFDGTNWVFVQEIYDPQGSSGDHFGISVAIENNDVLVGAPWDDNSVDQDGSFYYYQYNGTSWNKIQKIINPYPTIGDQFGHKVSFGGNDAVITCPYFDQPPQNSKGAGYIYRRFGNKWQRLQQVLDPASNPNESFGYDGSYDPVTKRFMIGAVGFSGSMGKVVFGKIN